MEKPTVTINLDLAYARPEPEQKIACPSCAEIHKAAVAQGVKLERRSNRELTADYIRVAIETVHPRIDGQLRRTVARLYRALDAAIGKEADTVEIERGTFDLIRDSLRDKNCEIQTNVAKYFVVFEDEIERVFDELKGQKEGHNASVEAPA